MRRRRTGRRQGLAAETYFTQDGSGWLRMARDSSGLLAVRRARAVWVSTNDNGRQPLSTGDISEGEREEERSRLRVRLRLRVRVWRGTPLMGVWSRYNLVNIGSF